MRCVGLHYTGFTFPTLRLRTVPSTRTHTPFAVQVRCVPHHTRSHPGFTFGFTRCYTVPHTTRFVHTFGCSPSPQFTVGCGSPRTDYTLLRLGPLMLTHTLVLHTLPHTFPLPVPGSPRGFAHRCVLQRTTPKRHTCYHCLPSFLISPFLTHLTATLCCCILATMPSCGSTHTFLHCLLPWFTLPSWVLSAPSHLTPHLPSLCPRLPLGSTPVLGILATFSTAFLGSPGTCLYHLHAPYSFPLPSIPPCHFITTRLSHLLFYLPGFPQLPLLPFFLSLTSPAGSCPTHPSSTYILACLFLSLPHSLWVFLLPCTFFLCLGLVTALPPAHWVRHTYWLVLNAAPAFYRARSTPDVDMYLRGKVPPPFGYHRAPLALRHAHLPPCCRTPLLHLRGACLPFHLRVRATLEQRRASRSSPLIFCCLQYRRRRAVTYGFRFALAL